MQDVDYAKTSPAAVIGAGTLNLDLKRGSLFGVILTENVTPLRSKHTHRPHWRHS